MEYYGVDLHVHTPFSKCYKGEKSDEEYISILKRYIDKGIKVIAITDHNSVNGYRELFRIKKDIERKIKTLEPLAKKYSELEEEIRQQKEYLSYFNQILVLPGIEFEANPGIHLLFIFDPSIDLDNIDSFLENAGYKQNFQGLENPQGVEISMDVLEALKRAKELNAITIAAHADSSKGIYNDLNGQYRARVFRSEYLDGISLNSYVNIEKIQNLFHNNEYKRTKPIAFIQSSDHHEASDCGRRITYFKLEKLNFKSIVECFDNPNEKISPTEKPEIKIIVKKIVSDNNTFTIKEIDNEKILKSVCAVLNNNFGSIVIGVSNDNFKNIIGVDIDNIEETKYQLIELISKNIMPNKIYYSLEISILPFGNKSIIVIFLQNISNQDFYYKNHYFILNSGIIEAQNIKNILSIKLNKQKEDFENYLNNVDEKLYYLHNEIQLLLDSKNGFNLISKIEKDAIKLSGIFKFDIIDNKDRSGTELNYPNGNLNNKVFYAEDFPARYDDCYLRFICPSSNELPFNDKLKRNKPAIILTPGAGTFIIESNEWCIYNRSSYNLVSFSLNEEFKHLSLYTILAWLKSTIILWYSHLKNGDLDFFIPSFFRNLYIPTVLLHNDCSLIIEEKVKLIIEKEKDYLKKQEDIINNYNESEYDQLLTPLIDNHNHSVSEIALEIDKLIFEKINLTKSEIQQLINFMEIKNLYFPYHKK